MLNITLSPLSLDNFSDLDAIKEAYAVPGSCTGYFFGGDYDDFADALLGAGWSVTWSDEGPFCFQATKGGDLLTYIEGDIYPNE